MKYVLGIDGGGTKSHLAVFTEFSQLVGTKSWGALNHECMEGAFIQLEQELFEFIGSALKDMHLSPRDINYAVLGLAGADTPTQCKTLKAIVEKIGFMDFKVINDAYLGVAAGSADCCGICAINGTGSTIAAIDKNKRQLQVGGIGELSDDCGGSTWYGLQMISQVYNELFRFGRKTQLTPLLLNALKLNAHESFAEKITNALSEKSVTFENMNRLVFSAANFGDEVALDIITRSAKSYAGSILHCATSMQFDTEKPLNITLAGSVFVKEPCPILPALIQKQVVESLATRCLKFTKLTVPVVSGAVMWALNSLNVKSDMHAVFKELNKNVFA